MTIPGCHIVSLSSMKTTRNFITTIFSNATIRVTKFLSLTTCWKNVQFAFSLFWMNNGGGQPETPFMKEIQNKSAKMIWPHLRLYLCKTPNKLLSKKLQKPPQNISFEAVFGPSGETRTPGILLPNAWTKFFVVICSAFRCFSLGIRYFLAPLNPLFPRVPAPTVVKYGVKNASWPGAAGVCQSRPGSVFRDSGFGVL